jgi:hypothetical protein
VQSIFLCSPYSSNFTLQLHLSVVIHYCTMVGFFSDLREMLESAGNSICTGPGRPGRLPLDFERDTAWVGKLLHEVRFLGSSGKR